MNLNVFRGQCLTYKLTRTRLNDEGETHFKRH